MKFVHYVKYIVMIVALGLISILSSSSTNYNNSLHKNFEVVIDVTGKEDTIRDTKHTNGRINVPGTGVQPIPNIHSPITIVTLSK